MDEGSRFYKLIKAIPAWAKTPGALTGAILALVGLSLLFQGNFYILALVFLPLLILMVLLLATSIIAARTKPLAASGLGQFVLGRGLRIAAMILMLAALTLISVYLASGPDALPARTPTPAWTVYPSTTVTPSPLDFEPKAPVPASAASQTLLFVIFLVITLVFPFTRPGAWNARTLREVFIGFVGWFLVNTLLWIQVDSSIARSSGAAIWQLERIMPYLVNLAALSLFFFTRQWVMLGMFSAILVNAIGTLLVTPVTAFYGDRIFFRIIGMMPFYLPPFFPSL